jgi:hypothetical protein
MACIIINGHTYVEPKYGNIIASRILGAVVHEKGYSSDVYGVDKVANLQIRKL